MCSLIGGTTVTCHCYGGGFPLGVFSARCTQCYSNHIIDFKSEILLQLLKLGYLRVVFDKSYGAPKL